MTGDSDDNEDHMEHVLYLFDEGHHLRTLTESQAMTTSAMNPDLCQADRDLLLAMTAEHNASMVVIEMLRQRVEGMVMAASLLREEGAHGHDLLKRFVAATGHIMAVDAARGEFKRVAETADDITAEVIVAWRGMIAASHTARMDLFGLCFVDEAPARKPWVVAHKV